MLYRAEFRPSFENGPERGHSGIAAVKNLVAKGTRKINFGAGNRRNCDQKPKRRSSTCNRLMHARSAQGYGIGFGRRLDGRNGRDGCEEFSAAVAIEELARHLCRTKPRGGDGRDAFIVSIDDDAEFVSPDTIAQTLSEFDYPRVGAVAI